MFEALNHPRKLAIRGDFTTKLISNHEMKTIFEESRGPQTLTNLRSLQLIDIDIGKEASRVLQSFAPQVETLEIYATRLESLSSYIATTNMWYDVKHLFIGVVSPVMYDTIEGMRSLRRAQSRPLSRSLVDLCLLC